MKDSLQRLAEQYSATDLKTALLIRLETDFKTTLQHNPNYFSKVERLGLTTRAMHLLSHRNIVTINQLVETHTERSISLMKGCGRASIEDIRRNLRKIGLKLRRDRVELMEFAISLFHESKCQLVEGDFPNWFVKALKQEPSSILMTGRTYESIYLHVVDLVGVCYPNIALPEAFLAEKGFEA